MHRSWARPLAALSLLLAVGPVACGGGSDSGAGGRPTTSQARRRTVEWRDTCTVPPDMIDTASVAVVFLDPGATTSQVDAVAGRLEDLGAMGAYFDQAKTFAEFKILFRDQPDELESTRMSELPTSFRLITPGPDEAERLADAIEGVPGVLRVKFAATTPLDVCSLRQRG